VLAFAMFDNRLVLQVYFCIQTKRSLLTKVRG